MTAKSIFWMIWYLVGLTVIPFFLLQTICQYYEESNLYGNIQIASIAYVVGIVIYVIIFTVFTCRIKNNLIQLLQNEQSRPQTPSKIVKEKPIKKWRKLRIPLLFIRISASYYRMLSRQSTNDTTTIRNTSALPINSDILRPDSLNFRQSPCQTIMKQIKSQPKDQDSNDFCLICFENEAEVVLHPCNHGGICQKCADHMIQTTKQCFLCRTQIKYALKVHQQGQIMEAIDVQKV